MMILRESVGIIVNGRHGPEDFRGYGGRAEPGAPPAGDAAILEEARPVVVPGRIPEIPS